MARYVDAVLEEYASWRDAIAGRPVRSVFIGGGTPSLLSTELLCRLLDAVAWDEGAEVTMEANPGTLDPHALKALRRAGVDRLSLGVQAMQDRLLKALGRIHTVGDVTKCMGMARGAGFENVSLDLMYGLPGQTQDDWRETLETATALRPEHISAYSLIVEEGTPLCDAVRAGRTAVPGDEEVIDMQRLCTRLLRDRGYERYEISNYARPGRECRHNLVYWQRGDYLGLGCAAHSLMDGERFSNPRSLDAYLCGTRKLGVEKLTREDRIEEALMLSTRLTRGLDISAFDEEFHEDFLKRYEAPVARLTRWGLARAEVGRFYLTEKGLELQNAVLVELMGA